MQINLIIKAKHYNHNISPLITIEMEIKDYNEAEDIASKLNDIAKAKEEAEELLSNKEHINVEDVDEYGDTFRETIKGRHVNDMSGDEPVEWEKIEECVPREDTDIDTGKRFLNYEDPDWISDDYEWRKNEDGTNITKEEVQ